MPAGAFRVLVAELATLGLDPARLCAEAGVDAATLADPARPLGVRALGRILARAEEVAGDPLLGLHLAQVAHGRGVLAYVFRAQPTVERALEEMARVAATIWEQDDVVRIARRGRLVSVAFEMGSALPRHAVEFIVARVALGLRQSGAPPREIGFRHAPGAPPGDYERLLGSPVRFRRPSNVLRVEAAALARPLPTASAEVAAALASGLVRSRAAAPATTAGRVTRAIEDALGAGGPIHREATARALGMSGKTLARRLAAEECGFRAIVETTRRRLAHRLVVDERIALGEVASRVGFADQAAFGKAFRRWFGASPSALRARRGA